MAAMFLIVLTGPRQVQGNVASALQAEGHPCSPPPDAWATCGYPPVDSEAWLEALGDGDQHPAAEVAGRFGWRVVEYGWWNEPAGVA